MEFKLNYMHITVNIKGKLFQIEEEVLLESAYFRKRLQNHNKETELLVDGDPFLFEHVLGFLTIDEYPFPLDLTSELDFYGIEYDGVIKCASIKCSSKVIPEDVYCDFCKRGFT
jgi:hypothetical protein